MIVDHRITVDDSTITFFENGSVQVMREGGPNEYLNSAEAEAILENY